MATRSMRYFGWRWLQLPVAAICCFKIAMRLRGLFLKKQSHTLHTIFDIQSDLYTR